MMIFIRVRLLLARPLRSMKQRCANDFDPVGDHSALHITSVTVEGDGEFVDNGFGTWTITPAVDFVGDASLSYTVEDADGGTATCDWLDALKLRYIAPNESCSWIV